MEQVQSSSLNHILSSSSSSPEFEFSSFPQPHLRSADQLFSDGFILPLHLLRLSPQPDPEPPSTSTSTFINTPKSWRYIFKKNYKNNSDSTAPDVSVVKETKKREKNNGAFVGVGAAELNLNININIWPFSRSRSAGNGGTRLRSTSATRRVSSAPCSRSSSAGESKTRKWPNSPIRGGVHLGRSSPVWQVRRNGAGRSGDAFVRKIPAAKARVLSLNVPMCIGYRNNLSCGNHQNSQASVNAAGAGAGAGGSVEGVRRSNFFNIRTLFSKKYH